MRAFLTAKLPSPHPPAPRPLPAPAHPSHPHSHRRSHPTSPPEPDAHKWPAPGKMHREYRRCGRKPLADPTIARLPPPRAPPLPRCRLSRRSAKSAGAACHWQIARQKESADPVRLARKPAARKAPAAPAGAIREDPSIHHRAESKPPFIHLRRQEWRQVQGKSRTRNRWRPEASTFGPNPCITAGGQSHRGSAKERVGPPGHRGIFRPAPPVAREDRAVRAACGRRSTAARSHTR